MLRTPALSKLATDKLSRSRKIVQRARPGTNKRRALKNAQTLAMAQTEPSSAVSNQMPFSASAPAELNGIT